MTHWAAALTASTNEKNACSDRSVRSAKSASGVNTANNLLPSGIVCTAADASVKGAATAVTGRPNPGDVIIGILDYPNSDWFAACLLLDDDIYRSG